ncbi:MAG TPA: discoidin domain-containing protein [Thermoanaerobaculia bacterium]|nr:discoidin domain-containing protein [Thermoanaerobaculia bacterium]
MKPMWLSSKSVGFGNGALRRVTAAIVAYLLLLQPVVAMGSPRRPARPVPPLAATQLAASTASVLAAPVAQAESFSIVLKSLGTPFRDHLRIDHHAPANSVLVTAGNGSLELIDAAGVHRPFSNLTGIAADAALAVGPDGTVYLSGTEGALVRVSPDGASIATPWITLPGETGTIGGLHVDGAGTLTAVTSTGNVWQVNVAGTATKIATVAVPLGSVVTVPDDADRYGPLAGKIVAGAQSQPSLYAIDAQGNTTSYPLGIVPGDLAVVAEHANFYGVDSAAGTIWGAPDAAFDALAGDLVVAQRAPGVLARLHWNGTELESSAFAQAARWDSIAFSPAGLAEIAPVPRVYEAIAVVRHAPQIDSGRIEGALWQLSAENVTLDGNDTITSDLLVPGKPNVTVSGSPSFSGTIVGTGSAAPSTHTVAIGGSASLRHVITHTNPIALEPVIAPPAPAGTRDVSLTKATDSAGDFSTIRNLSISGKAGNVTVPPGTYGELSASGRNALVFGVAGSTTPSVYNLESIHLTGGSELRLAGPAVVTVKNGVTMHGSTIGAADDPKRLVLRLAGGTLDVGGNAVLYAIVRAPVGAVNIAGNGRLRGTVSCDRLTVAGNGLLEVTENDVPPPPVNRPPAVDAGADATTTLPADTVTLTGTATDDGLPAESTLAVTWSTVSGPGAVQFVPATSAASAATFVEPGTYVLRLTASDGHLSVSDEMTVVVVPRNQAPSAAAGDDQTIELPAEATLNGSITDDGLPAGQTLAVSWSKLAGPGTVTFAVASAATTTAAFSAAGTYTLQLSVSDGELTATDDVVVDVQPQNSAPAVNAGSGATVRLPAGVSLTGTASDDGLPAGSTLTTAWSVASGPGTVTFANANAPETTATFSIAGDYVLHLTANDSRLSVTDDVTITVLPANNEPVASAGDDASIAIGANLLTNGGNEAALAGGRISGWTGQNFQRADAPLPAEGEWQFHAVAAGELTQDIDVARLPAGTSFRFAGAMHGAGSIVVEYRNDSGVLDTFDSGAASATQWTRVADTRPAPASTTTIRVRLASNGSASFDALSLRTSDAAAVPLDGTATDDGIPAALDVQWSKVSGPADVVFGDAAQAATFAAFTEAGTYVLRLTAEDSELSASDDVTVTVTLAAEPPAVDAGADQTVRLPATASLAATVGGDAVTVQWSLASGAGTVTFGDDDAAATTASFSAAGIYVLRVSATGAEQTIHDEVVVTVQSANGAPLVNAGAAQTITLPATATLTGVATDPDGQLPALAWSRISGPGTVTFANPASAATTASFSAAGDYVLRLTATDGELSAFDEVTVTVKPAPVNLAPIVSAGEDLQTTPGTDAPLNGSVTDDGLPEDAALAIQWSSVSGPGTVDFAQPNDAGTTARFSAAGTYVLRLTASDTALSASDEVTVVVRNGPVASFTVPGTARNAVAAFESNIASQHEGAAVVAFSSTLTGHPANLLIDDNPNTRWRSPNGQTTNQFIVIRLAGSEPRTFDRVRVISPGNNESIRRFQVQVSTTTADDAAFTTVLADIAADSARVQEFVLATPAVARYVRLQMLDAYSTGIASMSSFEVIDSRIGGVPTYLAPPNVAAQKENGQATLSSSGSFAIAHLNDDDLATAWTATSTTTTTAYFIIQFAQPYTIDRIRLENHADGLGRAARDFRIDVGTLNDVATFTTVLTGTALNATGLQEFILPGGPVRARYIRFNILKNHGHANQVGVRELQVVPVEAGKSSVSSYNNSSSRPEMMLDGDPNTAWISANNRTTNQYAEIRLPEGEPALLEGILIRPHPIATSEAVKDFELLVSNSTDDDAAFQPVLSGSTLNNGLAQKFLFPGGPLRARYVRFVGKNTHGGSAATTLRVGQMHLLTAASEGNVVSAPIAAPPLRNGSPVLIANGATVVASSPSLSGREPKLMLDYALDLPWYTSGVTNHFATILLAGDQPYTLRGVQIGPGIFYTNVPNDSVKTFEIWTSLDGVDFTKAHTGTVAAVKQLQTFLFASPVSARYVKYVPLTNNGASGTITTAFFDVVVAEDVGGVAAASAQEPTGRAELAIDGNLNTLWTTAVGQTANQWIKLALPLPLGQPRKVFGLQVNGYSFNGPKDYEIRISSTTSDDAAFSTVASGTFPSGDGSQLVLFNTVYDAKYVQFVAKNNYGGGYLAIRELNPQIVPENGGAVIGYSGSNDSSFTPSMLLDMNLDNATWQSKAPTNQFVTAVLPAQKPWIVDHVALVPRPDCCEAYAPRDFEIQVSNTDAADASFHTVYAGTLRGDRTPQHIFFPAQPVRFVRLLVHNVQNATYVMLQAFWVFSPQVGSVSSRFLDTSQAGDREIVSRLWEFGDGTTSSELDPLHVFPGPGTYDVRLTVTDANGADSTFGVDYRIEGPPVADYKVAPLPVNEGQAAVFTDQSSSNLGAIASREWIWGDGTLNGRIDANVNHIYNDNGTYQSKLEITNARGISASATRTVVVLNVAPFVNAGQNTTVPWGENWNVAPTVNDALGDRPTLLCHWDYGDGNSQTITPCIGSAANVLYSYAQIGTFTATLTATDKDGATTSDSVTITTTRRSTKITYSGGRGVPPGQPLTLKATLRDGINASVIAGKTLRFSIEGQTATGVTGADGVAEASLVYSGTAETPIITVTFDADTMYTGSNTTAIASCPYDQQPVDLALVFDLSGSIGTYLADSKAGATVLLDSLQHGKDQAAIVEFIDYATVNQQLTYDIDRARQVMNTLQIHGGTEMGSGITAAKNELLSARRNPLAYPVMVVLSDGGTSVPLAHAAANAAKAAGVRIISIAVGNSVDGETLMREVASSAADYYDAGTSAELQAIYPSLIGTLCKPANKAPNVDAGANQTITLPATSATLTGTVTDDGLPPLSVLTMSWAKETGPGTVTFSNATSATTTATFSVQGTYVLRLSANDTQYIRSDSVTINVFPPNAAPVVSAGDDRTLSLPSGGGNLPVTLTGTATDDGNPPASTLTIAWSPVSGAPVTFESAEQLTSSVEVTEAGTYVFRLSVSDGEHTTTDDVTIIVKPANRAPQVSAGDDQTTTAGAGATLSGAITDDDLPEGATVTAAWTATSGPAPVTFADATQAATTASFTAVGVYILRLTASDSALSAFDEVTITVSTTPGNVAPAVNAGADVSLTDPVDTTTLTGNVSDDGIPANTPLTVAWTKVSGPGEVVFTNPAAATTNATFALHGVYILRLTVSDSELSAFDDVVATYAKTPGNNAPAVNAGSDQTVTANSVSLSGTATDDGLPNGSTVATTWSKVSGPGSVSFADAAALQTIATFGAHGLYVLRLSATDSELGSFDDIAVTYDGVNLAPAVNAGADRIAVVNTQATLTATASDDNLPIGSVLSYAWTKVSGPADVTFGTPTALTTTALFPQTGAYVLRFTASDGALSAGDDIAITVDATSPPPVAEITSPESGSTITDRTVFKGTISGGTTWRLEYRLNPSDDAAGGAPWTVINTGTGPLTDAPLGMFDPTNVLNGTYKVRLVATDAADQTTAVSVSAVVEGQLKVGVFTLSFTDLNVPVAGLPIQVTRTYDSRDKRRGDFGIGWTLDVKSLRLEKSGVLGTGWYQKVIQHPLFPQYCLEPSVPRYVTITLPSGKIYRFGAATNPDCQQITPIQTPTMRFVPVGKTRGSLTALAENDVLVQGSAPGPVTLITADVEPYDPTLFRLTTEDGTVWVIDEKLGVQSVTDASGNKLTITAQGITHTSGRSITFTRDGQGRISKITDPAGKTLNYTYDGTGDLVTFTDQQAAATTFTYNADHGLLTITDANGIQPIRNEYDASGRLVRHVDAFGKDTLYTHDLAGKRESVTDRLGHVTVIEYDVRGNVVKNIDPSGRATAFTYDDRDNRLTETNALGKTTTYTYDADNNRTSVKDALGNVSTFTYDARRHPLTYTDPSGRVTTYSYDAAGRPTETKDSLGNTTKQTYTAKGLVETITDSKGAVTSFEYDAFGQLTKETDARGSTTTFTFDANGNRTSIIESIPAPAARTASKLATQSVTTAAETKFEYDAAGRITKTIYANGSSRTTEYDTTGKVLSETDQIGRKVTYEYDRMNRLIRTNYPDQTKEEFTYDAEGRRTSVKDRGGRLISYTYDARGQLTKLFLPNGVSASATYDEIGRIVTRTDPRGNVTRFEYDPNCGCSGRVTRVVDGAGNAVSFTYDKNGRKVTMTDARGKTYRYEYGGTGQLGKITYPDGTIRSVTRDANGLVATRTDEEGRVTSYEYDAADNLLAVLEPLQKTTRYTYDQLGRKTQETDALGRTTRFEYDIMSRLVRRTMPLGMSETFVYDAAGQVISRTDFGGKTTTYAYDVMGRLTQKTPDASLTQPPVTYTYTASGQRASMTDAGGTTTYTYDDNERLVSLATSRGTLTYTYDNANNLTAVRSSNENGVSADYAYDALNRLEQVVDQFVTNGATSFGYDVVGNLDHYLYPNGVRTEHAYDDLNRLKNLTATAAAPVASYAYELAPTGHRRSVTELNGRKTTYGYDELLRLVGQTVANDPAGINGSVSYTYDLVGNRRAQSSTLPGVPSLTYDYDLNDRLTSDVFDVSGNTVQSNGNTYNYDFENRISAVNDGAIRIVYDGDGNRVSKTAGGVTTQYLVDVNNLTGLPQVVEELRDGAVQRAYTYGFSLISQRQQIGGTWKTSYYGYDGEGSVRYLTNEAGAVTDTYDYDAFGLLLRRTGTTPNVYLYRGEQFDEDLGFYYLRARYMNPATGRFFTSDAYWGASRDPVSLHKYLYASADPVNHSDPTGYFSFAELRASMATHGVLNTIASYAMRGVVKHFRTLAYGVLSGGFIGGTQAALQEGDIWTGILDGMKAGFGGAVVGAIVGPLVAIKYIKEVLFVMGIGVSIAGTARGTADAIGEGDYAEATFTVAMGIFDLWYAMQKIRQIGKVLGISKGGAGEATAHVTEEVVPKYDRRRDYKRPTDAERKKVIDQNPICPYCGQRPSTDFEHVRSQKQDFDEGGWRDSRDVRSARVNDPSNTTGACSICNGQKGSRPLGEGEGEYWPPAWPPGTPWPFGGKPPGMP